MTEKKQSYNENRTTDLLEPMVLFIDMNSFFASCEQQVNYHLRGRPVGVCVYTGYNGCIISPSIEAKKRGIKTGMRLPEAMQLCPEFVPIEAHSKRYKDFHIKIMNVLRKYADNVVPKSIDEAVINLHGYKLIYKDLVDLAKKIKLDIKTEVGDWLKCSIGIAPNAFLAKLASDIQKPDGLTVISPENIDAVLEKLKLQDLPGIAAGMEARLNKGGIFTPLQLRHTKPDTLERICKSVVGIHWHYRLNFKEIDLASTDTKGISAMRNVSSDQRKNTDTLVDILMSMCIKVEERMVKKELFCKKIYVTIKYTTGYRWDDDFKLGVPIQDGMEIFKIIKTRMAKFIADNQCEPIINTNVRSIGVAISDLIDASLVQYTLFENNQKQDKLRKTIYEIKSKFGNDKLVKSAQLSESATARDVIAFNHVDT